MSQTEFILIPMITYGNITNDMFNELDENEVYFFFNEYGSVNIFIIIIEHIH